MDIYDILEFLLRGTIYTLDDFSVDEWLGLVIFSGAEPLTGWETDEFSYVLSTNGYELVS